MFLARLCSDGAGQSAEGFAVLDSGLELRVERGQAGADVGLSLIWMGGAECDASGRGGDAALFGRWLGRRSGHWERERGGPPATRVEVFGAGIIVGFHGAAEDAAAWLAALGGWLREPRLDEDEWDQVLAAARLAADDVGAHFPGAVVRQRARSALLGARFGRAPTGSVEELGARTRSDFERSIADRGGPRFAALVGGARAPLWTESRWRERFALLPAPVDEAQPGFGPAREEPIAQVPGAVGEHPLIEAVYGIVPISVPRPADPDFTAFAIAAEWLRLRAWQHFDGGSVQAEAGRLPLMVFEPELGPRLLFFGHRGRPGADGQAWGAEVAAFFDSLGRPTAADWRDARRALQGRFWPVVSRRSRFDGGATHAVRARALALGARWGRPLAGALDELGDEELDSALSALIAARRDAWLLLPLGSR